MPELHEQKSPADVFNMGGAENRIRAGCAVTAGSILAAREKIYHSLR
jgi:hypothetical protein